MARFEVITGPERRRRWSEDQKRAIVAESFAPGAVVSDVARRADISAGQIYRWRQELRAAACGFTPVLIAPAESCVTTAEDGPTSAAEPAIEVEFAGKVRVRQLDGLVVSIAAMTMSTTTPSSASAATRQGSTTCPTRPPTSMTSLSATSI